MTSRDHVNPTPLAIDGKQKGKIKFSHRLCEVGHILDLSPLMHKASKVFENLTAPQHKLHVGYQRISSNPLLVGKGIELDSSLSHPALPKHESHVSIPNQSLVEKCVNLAMPSVFHSVTEESSDHTSHVLLISSDSLESKSGPLLPVIQDSPPIQVTHGGNHMITSPSSSIVSYDWSWLTSFNLQSKVSFHIIVHIYNVVVHGTILDEATSVIIISYTIWQDLGSSQLIPVT